MSKITSKMAAFAEEYVKNGYNGAGAYCTAYGQENKQICASEAYKMLRDPRILEEIERVEGSFRIILQASGIDKKKIATVLAEMLEADMESKSGGLVPDYKARKEAVALACKLTGDFKEKRELEIKDSRDLSAIDPTKLSEEERKSLERDLLSEL